MKLQEQAAEQPIPQPSGGQLPAASTEADSGTTWPAPSSPAGEPHSSVRMAKDVDMDALAVRLDAHSRALRSDLLEYFLQLKESQLQQRNYEGFLR